MRILHGTGEVAYVDVFSSVKTYVQNNNLVTQGECVKLESGDYQLYYNPHDISLSTRDGHRLRPNTMLLTKSPARSVAIFKEEGGDSLQKGGPFTDEINAIINAQ